MVFGLGLLVVGLVLRQQLVGRVELGLDGGGQVFFALLEQRVNVGVLLGRVGLILLDLARQRLDVAAHGGRRVFQRIQVVFCLADVFVKHRQRIGLERLVHHCVQIGFDQRTDFVK